MSTPLENAHALIEAVRNALAAGCVHRNRAGKVLATEREIVECLLREGGVEVEDPTSTAASDDNA